MNCKGQIYLIETIMVFALFIAIIGTFLTAIGLQNNELKNYSNQFKNKIEAENCALIANIIYSNSFGNTNSNDSNCALFSEKIVSNGSKKAFSIAKEIKASNNGIKTFLSVEQNEHYK